MFMFGLLNKQNVLMDKQNDWFGKQRSFKFFFIERRKWEKKVKEKQNI